MPVAGDYETFRDELVARHQNVATSVLSTVGDVLLILGAVSAVGVRKFRLGGLFAIGGVVAAVVAHLFQPGTLGNELRSISSRPLWALRAEIERIFVR
jgi:hypothetical protein